MTPYRQEDQLPPDARRVTEVAVLRFEGVYEVEPELMREHVRQQPFPAWDTLRLVAARHDHLAWMHRQFARTVVSGQELLDELPDG